MDKEAFLLQYEAYSTADLKLIRDTQQSLYTAEEMALIEELLDRRAEEQNQSAKRYTWFYVLSLFIPLMGIIAGIAFLRSPEPEENKTGRQCIITGVIAILLWTMFVFGGFRL